MVEVTKRELNQNTAAVLARVSATSDIVVTERHAPRWRITAYQGDESPLTRLAKEGRYTPPEADPVPWPAEVGGPAYSSDDATALVADMRGDH